MDRSLSVWCLRGMTTYEMNLVQEQAQQYRAELSLHLCDELVGPTYTVLPSKIWLHTGPSSECPRRGILPRNTKIEILKILKTSDEAWGQTSRFGEEVWVCLWQNRPARHRVYLLEET